MIHLKISNNPRAIAIASPMSLEDIGKCLNITKEHVGRLKEKALFKLRNSSEAPVLRSCL
ncbi:sigma factor-like helix-turn-helix DNA-binding protein [Mucilaginibacter sp. McL0603]|uniref:sigma factor-like helix-turn-helix DNA-binding protein n=1 Tax=Mucilaginibacter sp. McL0603 TaxID=3415670 RepID=UPI003CEC8231